MNPAFAAALLTALACTLALRPRSPGLHRLAPHTTPRSQRPHPQLPNQPLTTHQQLTTAQQPTTHPLTDLQPTQALRSQPAHRHLRPRLRRAWLLIPPTAIATALFGIQALVSTLAITTVLALVANQRALHHQQKTAATRRANIIEALDVLAADLTAGRPPITALEGAASISPDFQPVHAAAKLGADVPAALTRAATTPGATSLRALAAAWRVTEESGAAFATLTERLANALRADEAVHRQTESSLAGARSTARILATLPALGIALGYALGADPLTFLTTTPPGWLCLTTGLALTALGLHWTTRLSTPST